MHDSLEAYLAEVSEVLHPLPTARRNDELREMRQHLLNAVMVNRELGQSEDEAARFAVDQFGSPQDLGEHVVQAWRRGKRLERRSFWGAAAFALLAQSSLIRLDLTNAMYWPIHLLHVLGWRPSDNLQQEMVIRCVFCILVGRSAVALFPRKVVAGMIVGTLVWYGIFFVLMGMGENWQTTNLVNYQNWLCEYVGYGVCAVLAAWAGRRWRTRKHSLYKALFS